MPLIDNKSKFGSAINLILSISGYVHVCIKSEPNPLTTIIMNYMYIVF